MKQKYFLEDWIGKKINSWTITGATKNQSGNMLWECVCDCGTVVYKRAREVIVRQDPACYRCTHSTGRKANLNQWYSGTKHVPGVVLCNIKSGALKRKGGIPVDITIQDLEDQWMIQEGLCAYTGIELTFSTSEAKGTASVDRIDSSIGYTRDNIQFIHKRINRMKNDLGEEELLSFCRLITEWRV